MTQTSKELARLYDKIRNPNDTKFRYDAAPDVGEETVNLILSSTSVEEAEAKYRSMFKNEAQLCSKLKVTVSCSCDEVLQEVLLHLQNSADQLILNETGKNAVGAAVREYIRYLDTSFFSVVINIKEILISDKKISNFPIYPLGRFMSMKIENTTPGFEVGKLWRCDNPEIEVLLNASNQPTKANLLAKKVEANKAKLFFQYFRGQRDNVCWFLSEAVEEGLNSFRSLYRGSLVVDLIETFFKKFSDLKIADFLLQERGLLLYGPPGTGKTSIIKAMSEAVGLTLVYPAFAAGAINESLVGEAEKKLMSMFQMARTLPWLPCAIVVDEIDGLAPSRTGDVPEYSIALLSVILAEFGGLKHVPNMFVFGSTNRRNEMDSAFDRRMQQSMYIGVMTYEARKKIICDMLSTDQPPPHPKNWLANNLLPLAVINKLKASASRLVMCTQNFTIDLMIKFLDKLLNFTKVKQDFAEANLHDFATLFTMQYLLHPPLHVFEYTLNPMPAASFYTGIHQSLSSYYHQITGRMLIMAPTEKEKKAKAYLETDRYTCASIGSVTYHTEFNQSRLIRTILEAANNPKEAAMNHVDFVQYIDTMKMISNGAHDEQAIVGQLNESLSEARLYRRSITVINIDQLILVSDNSTGSVNSRITPPSIVRTHVLAAIGAQFNALMNSSSNVTDVTVNNQVRCYPKHWIILVVGDKTIWKQLKNIIGWADIEFDVEEAKQERDKHVLKECANCRETYTEEENEDLSCMWHPGTYTGKLMNQRFLIDDPNDNDTNSKAKWTCCLQLGKGVQGCLKRKHVALDVQKSRLSGFNIM